MNRARFSLFALPAVALMALPLAAQDGSDILQGTSRPPLRRIIVPGASPDAGPTGIFPGKMRTAYGFTSITKYGAGQVIALVDAYDDPNAEADLGTFSTEFKLPACTTANGCFTKVMAAGTTADTTGWTNEIAIDIEWAHAIAPAAKILLVEAKSANNADLYAAVDLAVANGATVVSMSWGGSEASNEATTDSHFEVNHVTFVAASGDSGHGASYPAASPFVVSVGGTSLTIGSTGTWTSETAWSCNSTLACEIEGGSGGGLSAYEAEPAYQEGVQTTGKRGIPDVAYDADPSTGVPEYNSYNCGSDCTTGWAQYGGTSIGSPQWAALFAIANNERAAASKHRLYQPQTILYPAAEADYHDITSGKNGSCGAQCTATTGYDYVTGLGSPQANLLIPALVAAP
jgi:subtilase family serine protease